jgi:hypothetical protein
VDLQQQNTGYTKTENVRRKKDATANKEKVLGVEVNTQKSLTLKLQLV